jgi:plasmid stabilization system protein ParE
MRLRFEPEAAKELAEATAYLADQSARTAEGFLADVAAAKMLLLQFPGVGSPLHRNARRLLLKTFPYQLIYRVVNEDIRVYAVAHLKRKPGYWRKRLRQ